MTARGNFTSAQQQDQEDVRIVDIDLSQVYSVNAPLEKKLSGKYIVVPTLAFGLVATATDPEHNVTVSGTLTAGTVFCRVGSNTKAPILLQPGLAYKFDEFSALYFINTVSQPNKMLRLYISTNEIIRIGAPPQQISGTVAISENQTIEGASFWDVTPGAIGVTQIIATATNVNGIKIRQAWIENGANAGGALYADTAAPASVADATKRHVLSNNLGTSIQAMGYPMTLPAGLGLWIAVSTASATRSYGTYDVL